MLSSWAVFGLCAFFSGILAIFIAAAIRGPLFYLGPLAFLPVMMVVSASTALLYVLAILVTALLFHRIGPGDGVICLSSLVLAFLGGLLIPSLIDSSLGQSLFKALIYAVTPLLAFIQTLRSPDRDEWRRKLRKDEADRSAGEG